MNSTLTIPPVSEPYLPPAEPDRYWFVCSICGRKDYVLNDEEFKSGAEILAKFDLKTTLPNICRECDQVLKTPRSRQNGVICQSFSPPTIDDLLKRHRPTPFKKRPPLEIPAEFMDTDPNHPGIDGQAFRRVQQYRLSSRGLLLRGKSGLGKSRSAWTLLARLWSEGVNVRGYSSGNLLRVYEQKREQGWGPWFVGELVKVPVLLIDDLGNETRAEELIYDTIKDRAEKKRPTITTTQHPPSLLYPNSTNPRRVAALVRRLRDHFDDVVFSSPKAKK